jgi:hypothetical protein
MGRTRDEIMQNMEERWYWDVARLNDLRVCVVLTLIMLALATAYW